MDSLFLIRASTTTQDALQTDQGTNTLESKCRTTQVLRKEAEARRLGARAGSKIEPGIVATRSHAVLA